MLSISLHRLHLALSRAFLWPDIRCCKILYANGLKRLKCFIFSCECWSATNYVWKNALRILCSTTNNNTMASVATITILPFIFPTMRSHFPVSIYLSIHLSPTFISFSFHIKFHFHINVLACLICRTECCYCVEVFFHHIFCRCCYNFLLFFALYFHSFFKKNTKT